MLLRLLLQLRSLTPHVTQHAEQRAAQRSSVLHSLDGKLRAQRAQLALCHRQQLRAQLPRLHPEGPHLHLHRSDLNNAQKLDAGGKQACTATSMHSWLHPYELAGDCPVSSQQLQMTASA